MRSITVVTKRVRASSKDSLYLLKVDIEIFVKKCFPTNLCKWSFKCIFRYSNIEDGNDSLECVQLCIRNRKVVESEKI
jgi:hypothetical protein